MKLRIGKIGKRDWFWIVSLVSLGIVTFCIFQVFKIHNSLIYPFFIVAIVELWKDVATLRKKISQLEEEIVKK